MDFNHVMFSFKGRISRRTFWLAMLALAAIGLVLMLLLAKILGITTEDFAQEPPPPKVLRLHLLLGLLTLWPSFAINVKRLHDRNRATHWLVLFFILNFTITLMQYYGLTGTPQEPSDLFLLLSLTMLALALWLLVELGFIRGTRGDNPHGPDPLSRDDTQDRY